MKILVTGAAGFIGLHTVLKLLEKGSQVVGLDNINDYYDVKLKYDRLSVSGISKNKIDYNIFVKSESFSNYNFIKLDLKDKKNIELLFENNKFDKVCHLAAQAGVRHSFKDPQSYIDNNITGFLNIIEVANKNKIKHFVFASSSSVYGLNEQIPFSEEHDTDKPANLYAISKKTNELMAHTYSHIYKLKTTGLRFFTVYGPWGRPDMAPFLFTNAVLNKKPLNIFNNGKMERDFTYIDDIVEGVVSILGKERKEANNYEIFNIGNSNPVKLMDFISVIEKNTNKKALKNFLPMQKGDVIRTYADISKIRNLYNYNPKISVSEGIQKYVKWFLNYYKIDE